MFAVIALFGLAVLTLALFRSSVLVLPCLIPFAAIGLIAASRKHLREAGFTHGFLVPRRR